MTSWTRRFKEVIVTRFRRVARWAHGGVRHVFSFAQARLRPLVLLVLIAAVAVGVWGMISFWEWLRDGPDGLESGSTTVRNLGFVIAGVVALPLAIWRSLVAQRQADTAQQNLLNERYQQGAEMLGSDVLAVRLGGIYALERLAAEHPEQYHVQIMQLFCAFVRIQPRDVINEKTAKMWLKTFRLHCGLSALGAKQVLTSKGSATSVWTFTGRTSPAPRLSMQIYPAQS